MNKYKYMLIDGSYFLTRNYMVLKFHDDFSFSGLAKSFTQSIVKIYRDFVSADKVIIAWDKWSPECNGYFRNQLIDDYKGDRYYETEEGYEKLKSEGKTEEELATYRKNLDNLKIKNSVKKWILEELSKFGVPSIYLPGYEADDISRVFCEVLKDDSKKSCIVSKDSDWNYLINPNVDFVNGKDGTIVTYSEMKSKSLPDLVPLWKYKAIEDSLYGSHNNMMPSIDKNKVKRQKHQSVIKRIIEGDTDLIIDKDLYSKNLSTFDIDKLKDYDKLIELVHNLDQYGSLGYMSQFIDMVKKYKVEIYASYFYDNLRNQLDKNLYK